MTVFYLVMMMTICPAWRLLCVDMNYCNVSRSTQAYKQRYCKYIARNTESQRKDSGHTEQTRYSILFQGFCLSFPKVLQVPGICGNFKPFFLVPLLSLSFFCALTSCSSCFEPRFFSLLEFCHLLPASHFVTSNFSHTDQFRHLAFCDRGSSFLLSW